MSICIYILMAIMIGGFYAHDSLVLESEVNEMAAAWLAEPDGTGNAAWSGKARKALEGKLWLMDVRSVSIKNKWQSKTVQVSYVLPVSFGLVKKILSGGKSVMVYETTREELVPAEYIWTFGREEGAADAAERRKE